jgi:outer membrane biosynthesis protein TonB
MSEQERDKAGLHKEISSIFKGVLIPQTDGGQEPSDTPAPERTGYTEPKPPTPEPQQPCDAPAPERTGYMEPKPPTPEPQKPKAPKPYQAMQSLPKSTGARQPKADIDDTEKNVSQEQEPTAVKISSQTFRQQITNKLFTPKPGVSATRQKAMVVIVPLLFIALIFMLRGVLGTSVRKTEASAEDNASSAATAGLNTKIDWEIPAPYPTTLRDPMRLGPAAAAQTETETFVKLIVKGILYTEDNQSAVIGNQIVHEGEEIRGATVVKISKDSIEFEMNGKRWTQKVR